MKKNKTLKKKLIIFDLDGVIVNSLVNMRISWNYISKKFGFLQRIPSAVCNLYAFISALIY
jgi:beta-phosphoglucomutase-like phosphatase (HAD superfamily)